MSWSQESREAISGPSFDAPPWSWSFCSSPLPSSVRRSLPRRPPLVIVRLLVPQLPPEPVSSQLVGSRWGAVGFSRSPPALILACTTSPPNRAPCSDAPQPSARLLPYPLGSVGHFLQTLFRPSTCRDDASWCFFGSSPTTFICPACSPAGGLCSFHPPTPCTPFLFPFWIHPGGSEEPQIPRPCARGRLAWRRGALIFGGAHLAGSEARASKLYSAARRSLLRSVRSRHGTASSGGLDAGTKLQAAECSPSERSFLTVERSAGRPHAPSPARELASIPSLAGRPVARGAAALLHW